MTDLPTPRAGRVALANMQLAMSTILAAQDAGPDSSTRLCLFYGRSGYGKSVAAATIASRMDAVYVEAKSIWTIRSILEALAGEIGLTRLERTSPRLLQQIIDALRADPRPVLVDEFDHLVKKQMVEIIRDIHDSTPVPIMLIGEEALPSKLKAWDRFDNRVIVATPAQPASADDARLLRDCYCPYVRLADDIVTEVLSQSRGVSRRVVTNLQMVQRVALDEGMTEVDLRWWQGQKRAFNTGDLPTRRAA